MQIEEFNQYVKDHIKEYLPPEYETAKVSIQEVTKSNDRMLNGLTILREGENFSPTVYLEPFAEQVAQGRSLEDTLREITKIQTVHHAHVPVNISTFMDYAETGGTERLSADTFMEGITEMCRELVKEHTAPEERFAKLFPDAKGKQDAVGTCPRCGAPVYEGKKGFFCDNRDCAFALWKDNKFFTSKKKTITKSVAVALLK